MGIIEYFVNLIAWLASVGASKADALKMYLVRLVEAANAHLYTRSVL